MKQRYCLSILLPVFVSLSHAIGLQHGLFRSQSTQGEQWMGTAEIISEHYEITVYADYLDVELEWVFKAGGTEPDSFQNALEIVGNLNLEDNSVVVSMLVWYKDMILKGKLKTNEVARDEYEQVVERDADAPPPPRDPVLLEMIRDDNYDISIFPIEFGGTRKVRIRYLIPGITVNGVIKIGYPHAFTSDATVAVKKGPGVEGYRLETTEVLPFILDNSDFVELSRADYCFQPYGGTGGCGAALMRIVPIVSPAPEGSRLFVSDFSTETFNFNGTMAHLSTSGGNDVLLKSSIEEDYVVIWRWNNIDVLRLYTRQIVEQAALLKTFFSALNQSSKRGALIVSKQGGEMKSFRLDNRGGEVFDEMTAYLAELCELDLPQTDPTSSTTLSDSELKQLAEDSFEEFKQALETAVAMFDDREAHKYVLILTAGPNTITDYDINTHDIGNNDITVGLFNSLYVGGAHAYSIIRQSWPGVALPIIVPQTDTTLKIVVCITNGAETDSFQTNNVRNPVADRFIYSDKPIINEITWKLYQKGQLLTEFTETPSVTVHEDGMQYARMIGALKCMRPMTTTMPTSLASTLGFIDMKYTLVALEEDALDRDEAALYEESGVPLLATADIFPAEDEQPAIPVADWLIANPREEMYVPWTWKNGIVPEVTIRDFAGGMDTTAATGKARWANPVVETLYDKSSSNTQKSFSIASIRSEKTPICKNKTALRIHHGWIELQLGTIPAITPETRIVLYDLKGRVVMRWNPQQLVALNGQSIRLQLPPMRSGTYLIRLEKGTIQFSRTVVIQ
ncbi:MAG: T9SS type A sorting domain-containing protein [Chitinispirillaceae bacterium]|nr:T9SS type A sorting domain-containing protein [Chitinispirillaceae bacterium]